MFETAANVDFSDPATTREARPADGLDQRAGRRREGRRGLRRLPRRAAAGRQGAEDRHAGLLHGRRAGDADRRGACRIASAPARSFHGGGLVTDKPDSPHLLAPRINARMYFGVAANDDQRQPEAKDKLSDCLRRRQRAGRDRGLSGAPRLVRARHAERDRRADLQQARRRARLGQAARPLSIGARPSRSALVDDPFEQAKAHFFAALGRQQAGDLAEAERLYRASLALVPGRASTLINLAAVQLRLARPGDALAERRCGARGERDSVDALLHRATALAQLGRSDEALADFQRLLAIDPRHAAAWSATRHAAARAASARRGRARLSRGAAPWRRRRRCTPSTSPRSTPARRPRPPPADYVAGLFDSYADEFDSHLVGALRYQAHRQLVDQLVAPCGADARFRSALDLGCGTGLCGPLVRPMVDAADRRRPVGANDRARRARSASTTGSTQADIVEFLDDSEDALGSRPRRRRLHLRRRPRRRSSRA